MTQMTTTPEALRSGYRELLAREPNLRDRDIADRLGASEAQLVAARCGEEVVRLRDDFTALFDALPRLGRVMALSRNRHAVIEKVGAYAAPEHFGAMGQVIGEEIDLRLFPRQLASAFVVDKRTPQGVRRSLQMFDPHGDAAHKVFLREESDAAALSALAVELRADEQSPEQAVTAPGPARAEATVVDQAAFQAAWDGMTDTHDFFTLLRRFQLDRLPALRLADSERARPVAVAGLHQVLVGAAQSELPIMVFVASRGVVQIHKGPIARVQVVGPWLNVMDPGFNLHLHQPGIASLWVVRKPTVDGIVTSLEAYASDGELAVQLFGRRKPGQAELPAWRALAEGLNSAA